MRFRRLLGIILLSIGPVIGTFAPASAASCQYVLGFKALHDLIPATVGNCTGDEQHNPLNGDGIQDTAGPTGAGGLLVWRKADNWTAFTDGYRTWLNGPQGLQARLNTDRFPWEGDFGMVDSLQLSDLPTGFTVYDAGTGAVTNDYLIGNADNQSTERAALQKWGRTSGYQGEFTRTINPLATNAAVLRDVVNLHSSVSGAQTAWNEDGWAGAPDGWTKISAPQVGDQSDAFTRPNVIKMSGQSINATDYLVQFRSGSVIGYVQTGNPETSADLNAVVALARIMVTRIQAHS